MSDEHPPPDDGAEGAGSGHEHGASAPLDDEIVARLHALDHLYQAHEISASELAEARAEVLSGVEHPHRYHAEAPPPPPPPPPPTEGEPASPAAHEGEGAGGEPTRVLGLPVGVAAAIGAFIVVGAIVLIVALVMSGGDDGPAGGTTTTETTQTTAGEYPQGAARASLDQLNSSAVTIGTALAQTSDPDQLPALRRAAERQIELVEQARRRLSEIAVPEGDRAAHERLIEATAAHRRYLVQLQRATAGEPGQANLAAVDRARQAGAEMRRAYAAFFALAPAAPDAVTGTDLTDTAGLKSAIRRAIAEREAEDEPVRTTTTIITEPDSPDGIYGGSTFQSPTGNLHCQDQGDQLFCSSSNDNFGVWLPRYGPPVTGNGVAPGGGVLPYGAMWSSGAFTCASETSGITCRNLSGDGFFLSRDEYRAL